MFKAIHGIAPAYICDNICFSYEVNGRNLRSYDNMILHQPIPNYEICKHSLAYNGPTIWNALPRIIKTSIMQFKREYKNVIFMYLYVFILCLICFILFYLYFSSIVLSVLISFYLYFYFIPIDVHAPFNSLC